MLIRSLWKVCVWSCCSCASLAGQSAGLCLHRHRVCVQNVESSSSRKKKHLKCSFAFSCSLLFGSAFQNSTLANSLISACCWRLPGSVPWGHPTPVSVMGSCPSPCTDWQDLKGHLETPNPGLNQCVPHVQNANAKWNKLATGSELPTCRWNDSMEVSILKLRCSSVPNLLPYSPKQLCLWVLNKCLCFPVPDFGLLFSSTVLWDWVAALLEVH